MNAIKLQLSTNPDSVETKIMYFVSLPTDKAHTGHPTGPGVGGFSQRINEQVAAKIAEIVAEGITDKSHVRNLLRYYVVHDLCKDALPDHNDRAYYPMDNDLKNHIYTAKRALQLSCLDQQNAQLKIQQWKTTDTESTHFFRPYIQKESREPDSKFDDPMAPESKETNKYVGNDGGDDSITIRDDGSYTQTLLWVHQTEWQKALLKRYGNTISLIDATYKTTRYELALFFICVRTNVGYSVVAEFIVQGENAENIQEALTILTQWNPEWNPRFFMSDYSEAELNAIEAVFPTTTVYLCDFHREQAWMRWTHDHKHGLSPADAEALLDLLRTCAWAPPVDSDPGLQYRTAVSQLKNSPVWKNHLTIRQWLSNKWLSIPKVCVHNFNAIVTC